MKIVITYNVLYLLFPSKTVSGGEIKFKKCKVETTQKIILDVKRVKLTKNTMKNNLSVNPKRVRVILRLVEGGITLTLPLCHLSTRCHKQAGDNLTMKNTM